MEMHDTPERQVQNRGAMTRRLSFLTLVLVAAASSRHSAAAVDYEKDIKTLFKERCISCHGAVKQKGKLRLDAGALILKGGENRVVIAGDSRQSDLVERLQSDDKDERMPPEGKRLTTEQIALVRQWIDQGA